MSEFGSSVRCFDWQTPERCFKRPKNLVKKYSLKKKDDGEKSNPPYPPFTYEAAFSRILDEILHLACQHETVAESYHDEICPDVSRVSKQLKEERKSVRNHMSFTDCRFRL
ncbi:unnamed protein product [Soboliphyme baturini]|uniref:Rab3 GTPase-activating protein catalytic subunit n=1 Tax=Soboliphyme baturini TaxID=241478 RepID=A0A183IHB2_9BILA|nr:unnamed protein product [Soboliphyme baturini]